MDFLRKSTETKLSGKLIANNTTILPFSTEAYQEKFSEQIYVQMIESLPLYEKHTFIWIREKKGSSRDAAELLK